MYQCRAPGLPQPTSSELTHISDDEAVDEAAESELDLDEVYQQLELMKQRLLLLRNHLVREAQLPDEFTRCDEQVELHGSQNVELRELQRDTMRMSLQIAQVVQRLMSNRQELKLLDYRMQNQRRQSEKLRQQLAQLPEWKQRTEHHFGLCIERFHDLNTTCCHANDCTKFMRQLEREFVNSTKRLVPLHCYQVDRWELWLALRRMRSRVQSSAHMMLLYTERVRHYVHDMWRSGRLPKAPSDWSIESMFISMAEEMRKKQKICQDKAGRKVLLESSVEQQA